MNRIYVKPRPGVQVRHHETKQHIAEGGEFVNEDSYFVRRIADGDLVLAEPPAESKADKK